MNMPSCAFITLGCKLNYAETSSYERILVDHGFIVVAPKEKADYYIVNTCSVTEHADKKGRNLIAKAARTNPEGHIVVVGCYAELQSEVIAKLPGVLKVFRQKDKKDLVDFVIKHAADNNYQATECAEEHWGRSPMFAAYSSGERTRSFLKVQDGCDYYCKYCTVPYARGHSRNIPIAEIVDQAKEIAAKGIKEVVLTGVNTGDFGKTTGESFLDLLKALQEVDGIERYRISSIEPNLLTDEIIDWIASTSPRKVLPHFHIPLQSGSDTVLKAMGRRYTTEFFESKINYIRQVIGQDVFFGIDVIVGFPGETDALFEETVAFLSRIKPAFIHIFPYSRRRGTIAAEMPDQVDEFVKTYRVGRLETLCDQLHREFEESQKGQRRPVLFESRISRSEDGVARMQGYTDNYIQVVVPYEKSKIGKIVEVEL